MESRPPRVPAAVPHDREDDGADAQPAGLTSGRSEPMLLRVLRRLWPLGIVWLLAACTLLGQPACPTALLEGTLVDDHQGGLAVATDSGVATDVRWPDGYRVGDGDALSLRDGWGRDVAAAGDTIYVGGGMNAAEDQFIACGYVSRDPP